MEVKNLVALGDVSVRVSIHSHSGIRVVEKKKIGGREGEKMNRICAYRIVCLRKELLSVRRYPIRCIRIILFQRCSRGGYR